MVDVSIVQWPGIDAHSAPGPLRQAMPWNLQNALMELAEESEPREVCGFITNTWNYVLIPNVASSDSDFKMSPQDQLEMMEQLGDGILGIFHSHPGGGIRPSNLDVEGAPPKTGITKEWRYWIVTDRDIAEWDIRDGVAAYVPG